MQLCSKDELWEAAKEEEMKIPWKEANEESPVSEGKYQERFWREDWTELDCKMMIWGHERHLHSLCYHLPLRRSPQRISIPAENVIDPRRELRGIDR
jgi:hypothetical protein